eukprot:12823575-Heterocapsa_arctica.AAC.1
MTQARQVSVQHSSCGAPRATRPRSKPTEGIKPNLASESGSLFLTWARSHRNAQGGEGKRDARSQLHAHAFHCAVTQ